MKRTKRSLIVFSAILLFFAGIAIFHWNTQESTLLDVLEIDSTNIMDASICDANSCINTEIKLDSEQIETVMQLFSQTKIKKICGRRAIQNSYARFFIETENCKRYELLLASNEVLINCLNDNKWYVCSVISLNNDLEELMKKIISK